jgi:tRNA(fMet)-specific endonuclease VapC
MTAFDTDVLSELLADNPAYVTRAATIEPDDQYIPVVAAAEVMRGWLNAIRQAEAGKGRVSLEHAYHLFQTWMKRLTGYRILPYTPDAHARYIAMRASKLRIGTNDLRIAAICLAHNAKLVTRNARDYAQVPGLNLEVWN